MKAWNVFLNGENIDTVFYQEDIDAEEVKRGLIDHDGYHPGIEVKEEKEKAVEVFTYLEKTNKITADMLKVLNGPQVTVQPVSFDMSARIDKFVIRGGGFRSLSVSLLRAAVDIAKARVRVIEKRALRAAAV